MNNLVKKEIEDYLCILEKAHFSNPQILALTVLPAQSVGGMEQAHNIKCTNNSSSCNEQYNTRCSNSSPINCGEAINTSCGIAR